MLFTSSILRLDTLLCANAIALPPDVRDALDLSLQHQLAKGDVAAIKAAAHHLKATTASVGAPMKQSLAFEAIASYLGARDWNTLRAHVDKSGLTLATRGTEVLSLFTREGLQFARFTFELVSKGVGLSGLTNLFRQRPGLKLRLLSRYSPAIHPALEAWREQATHSDALPLLEEVMARRSEYLLTRAALEASFRDRSARAVRHFAIAEVPVAEMPSDSAALEKALAELRSRVKTDLEKAFRGKLKIEHSAATVGFETIEPPISASLEPWHGQPFSQVAAARSRFDSLLDLESVAPEVEDWPVDAWGSQPEKLGFRMSRHGIVAAPNPHAPAQQASSGLIARMKKALLPEARERVSHPAYALSRSPWNAPLAASDRAGMLLQQREQGLSQFAPWGGPEAENFLILATSGGGKTFLGKDIIFQAIAHGKRLRAIDFNHEHFQFFRDVLRGEILSLDTITPQSLNPFSGLQSELALRQAAPAMASLLLELLELTDETALPLLESAFLRAWELHREVLDIGHIKTTLEQMASPPAHALAALITTLLEVAGPWLLGPGYTFGSPKVLIELGELNRNNVNPVLRACIERTVLGLLHQESIRNPAPSVHLYEEAWKFSPSERYLKKVVADCNKADTSIGLTHQTFRYILTEPLGMALFHPDITVLQLSLRYEDSEVYEKSLKLSKEELEVLRTLRPSDGFTQVGFIRKGMIEGVFEFALDSFTRLLYATSARDLSRIMDKVAAGHTYLDAVRLLADADRQREGL